MYKTTSRKTRPSQKINARHISGITFIRYTQKSKDWKAKYLKVLAATKPKGLNSLANIG
jgi:hypothetical protein